MKTVCYAIKRIYFSSSHRYTIPSLTAEENIRIFGPCVNTHGHNYTLDVVLKGRISTLTGMVINLKDAKEIARSIVDRFFDHRDINEGVDEFAEKQPTTENILLFLWKRLKEKYENAGVLLSALRLYETDDFYVEYKGGVSMYITRVYNFSAAHRMWSPFLKDDENRRIYGKCENIHGHNFLLEVTVKGDVDPETGMAFNINYMDEIVKKEIIERYDHKYLNSDCDDFENIPATSENLTRIIWERLCNILGRNNLCRIRLWETPNNCFECNGEEE